MIGVMFSNILFFGRRLPVLFLPRSPAVIGSRRFPLHFYILRVLLIRHMLHNILNVAFQNGADTVKGKNLNVLILAELMQQTFTHLVLRIKVILGNMTFFHGFPQPVIFYHDQTP